MRRARRIHVCGIVLVLPGVGSETIKHLNCPSLQDLPRQQGDLSGRPLHFVYLDLVVRVILPGKVWHHLRGHLKSVSTKPAWPPCTCLHSPVWCVSIEVCHYHIETAAAITPPFTPIDRSTAEDGRTALKSFPLPPPPPEKRTRNVKVGLYLDLVCPSGKMGILDVLYRGCQK